MALTVTDKGGMEFKQVPQGTHIAVCDMVVDLGIQPSGYGPKHKVYIRWELPNERVEWTDKDNVEHEGPMSIGNFYTASLSEKAILRKDLEGWRGRAFTKEELAGFDLFNVLGVACQVSVTHNTEGVKTYANVTAVAGIPKGMERPKAQNPLLKYGPDDLSQYNDLPEWLRKKIDAQIKSELVPQGPAPTGPDFDDDIPF